MGVVLRNKDLDLDSRVSNSINLQKSYFCIYLRYYLVELLNFSLSPEPKVTNDIILSKIPYTPNTKLRKSTLQNVF